jgi:hypothetical protein
VEESYDVGAAWWERQKPNMRMWHMAVLEPCNLHASGDPLMRKILQYHMREICCKQQRRQHLQQRRALAAGSEFWPVRTLLTEKHQWQQTHLPNGDCHVELLTRKPCPGGKHDGGSDLCVPQYHFPIDDSLDLAWHCLQAAPSPSPNPFPPPRKVGTATAFCPSNQ